MNLERATQDVQSIFSSVLRATNPESLVRRSISVSDNRIDVDGATVELNPGGKIVLLGVGKSAVPMARGVEAALGDRLDHGLVVTKRGLSSSQLNLRRTEVIEASHPVPDDSSIGAANRLLDEASRLTAEDLVICVISGGGSSLVEAPVDGVTLTDLRETTSILLNTGADIWTLNAVRRRLSRIKAGGLARSAAPARVVNLILSDVLGNPLNVIASGLSVVEEQDDRWRVDDLKHGPSWNSLPDSVRQRLGRPESTPAVRNSNVVQSVVVGDAATAATAAVAAAAEMGYRPFLMGTHFAGDAREFGRFWGQLARSAAGGSLGLPMPCCLIAAGEMTVNVRGDGRGGRNTEMVTSAAFEIAGVPHVAVASLATDGDDGSSGAAGGVAVGQSLAAVRAQEKDARRLLDQNDTRAFLAASGGLIVTGLTGTNVNDLYIALVDRIEMS